MRMKFKKKLSVFSKSMTKMETANSAWQSSVKYTMGTMRLSRGTTKIKMGSSIRKSWPHGFNKSLDSNLSGSRRIPRKKNLSKKLRRKRKMVKLPRKRRAKKKKKRKSPFIKRIRNWTMRTYQRRHLLIKFVKISPGNFKGSSKRVTSRASATS